MADFKAKEIPEGINNPSQSPLKDILLLVAVTFVLVGAIYYLLGLSVGWLAQKVPYQTEIEIGRMMMDSLPSLETSESPSEDDTEWLEAKQLSLKLWEQYREKTPVKLNVLLDSSPLPNAFMAPGGFLSITQGLLDQTETENELAFVICHEIGHFLHRHALEALGRSLVTVLFLSFVGSSGLDTGWLQTGLQVNSLAYSREAEIQADQTALECLHQKYGHVQDHDAFFTKSQEFPGGVTEATEDLPALRYLSTHPMPEERIQNLHRLALDKGFPLEGLRRPWPPSD